MRSEDERSGVAVQLCRSRDSSGRKSSASNDSGDRERGPGGARRRFFGALFPDVTTFDPTETLLRAMLLQALDLIRSERQLMEGLEFDLLFRWFVASASTTRRGIIRRFPRTMIGCWKATSPRSS
jgi:hypothetical protein